MATKLLNVPEIKIKEIEKLVKLVMGVLNKELYQRLISVVPGLDAKTLKNARGDLKSLIRTGKLSFSRGKFYGKFTASVSKELIDLGAKWNIASQTWDINLGQLPADVAAAIRLSEARFLSTMAGVNEALGKILPENLSVKLKAESFFATEIFKLDRDLTKAIKTITVPAQLTELEKAKIADGYAENLDKYIKKFTQKEIIKLREQIQENVYSGNRYENLIKTIQDSYNVSENKARFLARQETKLLTAEIKKTRSVTSGSPGYIWKCVAGTKDHPVRPDHKRLDGKYFTWDDPPVTNLRTGAKNSPGQDYNCRCRAQIVFREPAKK